MAEAKSNSAPTRLDLPTLYHVVMRDGTVTFTDKDARDEWVASMPNLDYVTCDSVVFGNEYDRVSQWEGGISRQVCSLWQLSPDREAYGDRAGWYILVTPDGKDEIAGPWQTEEEARSNARMLGYEIVPLAE